MSILRDVARCDGSAVLVMVPDMPDVAYADKIACLSDGELLHVGDESDATDRVVDISSRRSGRTG
jgi:ABC-type multidrug transport system ATPase subunit